MGKKKPIVTPFGQWAYPGEITVIPSNTITMKGVDYPVMGIDNLGNSELMLPGGEYTFPGDYVTEIPQMGKGGLTQWFAEEWTDVKTGKPCGRSGKEKGSRPYPACRPKKRVNETTPKTTSEMSSAEKAKFKREKTSGKRIDYNHKRREFGGQIGWLDSYQDGGLYAVGPYDEMMAPKQGNYLLPDINRPSYLDEFGGMRSEYKMGFNDDGKEVLIPTVVQGKQLSEDEAVDNYYRTGLHMGKYDTVQDAENASALRTAKYNMLQDPVRFDMTQYQKGGSTPTYQDSLALYNYNQLQRRLENKSDIYEPSLTESILGNYSKLTPQGKKDQNALRAEALKILKNNPNIKPGLYNIPKGLTRSSISDYDAAEGSYDLYHPGIKPQGAWFGIATNNDYSNVKPTSLQKEIPYPNQPIGTGMKRSISKNTNPIQKSTPTPIYVNDPNDPRLKSYNDSLSLYNQTRNIENPKYYEKGKSPNYYSFSGTPAEAELFASANNIIQYNAKFPGKIQPVSTEHWGDQLIYPKYKKPVQPVKYRDSEIAAKQQQLLEAGYNIGEADGIWGPKSQEAWDQMNASKQTTQTNSQVYQTPTVVVKDINEDKANTLRNQYQDSTGTPFKSKDQIFNSLQQSLKRKPTVKEYNDAVEQFNRANRSMKYGGWLDSYQSGGERSTAENPESIGQVHIRAKDKGWFDNYIKRPLRKFGRSYAQRISDATGGSEWYKQANPFMNLAFESINAPQYAATYAVTGKVQTPSEALEIKNPIGAIATDILLDPLAGPAIAKGLVKGLPAAARYATTKTPLKNAWKLNPKAYQYNLPENTMWRGLGQEGMEDAINSGVFRSKQNVPVEYFPGSTLRLSKSFGTNPYFTPKFKTAASYGDNYLAEVSRDAANWKQRYARTDWSQVADRPIPVSEGRILQKDWLKGYKPVEVSNNIGTAKLYDKVVNVDSLLGEGLGELIAGRKNRKALSEGNTWLKNWIADPITQNKIENDLVWASQRQDQYGLGYQQAKSFVPNVREYPLSEQMKDFFIRKEGNIHAGNSGISYLHNESPITRQRRLIDEQIGIAPGISMKYYGSWVSRNPAIKQSLRKSTVIHEGTHDWTTNFLLNNSGQADAIKNLYSDKIKNISEQWKNLRKQGISPSQVMGEQNANLGYLADPTEVHARIMELRQLMKMTPEQSVMVTPEKAQNIIRSIENPKNAKFIDPKFLDVIDKDPKKLAALFNRLWAAPAATALGASQLQEKKYGGWLDSYQSGGETSTEQNPTRIAPVDIRVKRKKVSDSNRYMYDAEGNLVYNPSLDIYPLIAEGSTQEETTFQPNLPVDLLNPTLEELVNVAGPYYPIDNRLASGDRINLPASDLQRSLEQDYILPQMVGRSFGNLPLNRGDDIDDGYGPSRRWTTNLNEHPGNYFLYSPETYAYVLKADKSSLVDFDKKRQVESGMSNLDQRFNEALANQGYNSEMVDDYTANRPNQIWNRAEQARVEMLNNPEIREWARLHNLDLSNKYRDKYDKEVAAAETDDGFASKIPESVYANRLVKAGLPTSRPDYDYRNIKTFIIQDPSKFNLAGYFPIDQEMINSANNASYKNFKKIMAERMGIDPAKFDTGEYLIHYNRSPISEYTPGMKNGGWLNKYK